MLAQIPKARSHVANRVLAKMVDIFLIVAVAAILPYPLGSLLAFAYSLMADGMSFGSFRGQSVGKKIFGLQVVHLATGTPCGFRESAFRNAPVGVATFFSLIPVWGWLILILVGIPLMAMEIYLMWSVETGHRLGDVMGDTEVVQSEAPLPISFGFLSANPFKNEKEESPKE